VKEVSSVTATYEQVTSGYWLAVAIGAIGLSALITLFLASVRRARHHRRDAAPSAPISLDRRNNDASDVPYERCRALIAEGMIVRDRVSGQIDAATYQARMKDLVTRESSPRR
jgi:hypothetical protein